ncbi:MAG: hypothetical protein PGN09_06040 [Sphingomonas fennica]
MLLVSLVIAAAARWSFPMPDVPDVAGERMRLERLDAFDRVRDTVMFSEPAGGGYLLTLVTDDLFAGRTSHSLRDDCPAARALLIDPAAASRRELPAPPAPGVTIIYPDSPRYRITDRTNGQPPIGRAGDEIYDLLSREGLWSADVFGEVGTCIAAGR